MKKGAIIVIVVGIIVIAVIIAGNNITQNQTTESIRVDTTVERATNSSQISTTPSQSVQTTKFSCDPSYPDVCIASWSPNLDCGEILYRNFKVIGEDKHGFDGDKDGIGCETTSTIQPTTSTTSKYSSQECSGIAGCIIGTVTRIIDGDTIHVDNQSVRFSLASAPELKGFGGVDSRNFIQTICPVGSEVLVDEDDGHILGSYGRMVGMITCNDVNLNEELLDANLGHLEVRFCSSSEFANESWAIKHGCIANSVSKSVAPVQDFQIDENKCDPSYPDFCIPSGPPDLDCKDIPQKRFTVLPSDPHRFDGDKDGIGCES
ncbi:MAG: thermonuclease family protein [Nitrosopumilus sp.]|nr:thermonuclease family protein [Nitrosopumilus sp.]